MIENAKNYPGNEGYAVTEDGRVYRHSKTVERKSKTGNLCSMLIKGKWAKSTKRPDGYHVLNIDKKVMYLHRMVAETFLPLEDYEGLQVNHIDGNKDNNSVSNLEWISQQDNLKHARDTGLQNNAGENNGMSKLTERQVIEIRELVNTHTLKEVANMFNVSASCISAIKLGKTYKEVV